ncbi:uncharacterized protein LOC110695663 isoform X2 [Chenopodium quinoa]|uniref:uncharacterized protein LOC110695663 isoform X2 n=1 Tax=Chenopodium quinoa TaxID=63459 RepID=UPI000B76F02A|nr:uncharacterized protein LOC110695663 isoform X2 [Chenopodium quinoa]
MEVQRFNRIMTKFKPICDEASMVDDDTVDMVLSTLSKLRIDVSDRRKKFIEANGVLTLPSTQYPTSGKGSTSNAITPSSERKRIPTHTPEGVDLVDPDDDVPDQVVSQPKAVPQISQQLLDPNTNKRPRGRPKGSRNKPLSETGYKTTNKKQDVQPTDADMDMDLPMRDVLPSLAAPKLVPAKVVKLSLLFQSIKCCYNLKLELMLYSVNFGTL